MGYKAGPSGMAGSQLPLIKPTSLLPRPHPKSWAPSQLSSLLFDVCVRISLLPRPIHSASSVNQPGHPLLGAQLGTEILSLRPAAYGVCKAIGRESLGSKDNHTYMYSPTDKLHNWAAPTEILFQ